MTTPILESAFTTGEVAPALFGNVQLARMHSAASTMRNFFVGYQGGAYSRAGTAFVGFSKQTGRNFPPRLIPFQFSINQGLMLEFGNFYMRVVFDGAYVTEAPVVINSVINTNPVQLALAASSFASGDWLFVKGIIGPTVLNNQAYVAQVIGTVATLFDVYGNPIDGTTLPTYLGGGTVSRIFTLATQYSEQDLAWMKFTQSADVMTICCVNQVTGAEYPQVDLSRTSDTQWAFTSAQPAVVINQPASVTVTASAVGSADYLYQVTAVDPATGSESSGRFGLVNGAVDIAATAGTITITWTPVAGTNRYNVYKALPSVVGPPPSLGSQCGYAATCFGTQLVDSNIVPDFTQVPPTNRNPFVRGGITAINPVAGGSGYTTAGLTITTSTGSGAAFIPIIVNGAITSYVLFNSGSGYLPGDTVTVTGDGTGATATLLIGPNSGTYPAVVSYFQQRRAFAYTLNQPDTYFMSQPGSFLNFDVRTPTIDSDSITGTPWSVQVNGIQFMIPVSGALIVMTGLEAYLLTGEGGSAFTPQPLTPSSQSAQNQGFNGCSATIPPIRIYQDVLYVQAKGTTYRDFSFDVSKYSFTGDDITQNSTQLFDNFSILQHAWCEEPFRVLWAVRSDGALLSLTWMKTEKVAGWARHDTFGIFVSAASITELPVDALYVATQRIIGQNTAYIVERMNNRLWNTVQDSWCVDCGFALPVAQPIATLSASSPTGLGSLTGVAGLVGGAGYSAASFATITDDDGKGPGVGAVAALTIVAGVITAVNFTSQGAGYVRPRIDFVDPAGSAGGRGASAIVVLNNTMVFSASANVFANTDVGSVIRMGGGVATITAFTDARHVTANITTPISQTYPDGLGVAQAMPQVAGNWTLSAPITTVSGLQALAGATVGGLADGVKITPRVVSAQGTVTLDSPASQVTLGLPFQAQLQSTYLDAGEPTVQGQRKDIPQVTARVLASGQFKIGSNQPDGSTLSPPQVAPVWAMQDAPITTRAPYNSLTVPLCTDDIRIPVNQGYSKHGQVCVQQDDPYPLNVLCFVPQVISGDTASQVWPEKQGKK